MKVLEYVWDDGGRASAGYKGAADDCVCRAIAIATQIPYKDVYKLINEFGKRERFRKGTSRSSARTGVHRDTIRKIMNHLGWRWVPTMFVGSGCTVHLKADELPSGRLVVSLSKHMTAVVDGVLHDTYDCSRDETRCVYGYFVKD